MDIPGRLSKVLDLPVAETDGLSCYICRPFNRKFSAAESFRSLARSAYDKGGFFVASQTPRSTNQEASTGETRKRPKSSSGDDASPNTTQLRPAAKRVTTGTRGRRLSFSPHNASKTTLHTNTVQCSSTQSAPDPECPVVEAPSSHVHGSALSDVTNLSSQRLQGSAYKHIKHIPHTHTHTHTHKTVGQHTHSLSHSHSLETRKTVKVSSRQTVTITF